MFASCWWDDVRLQLKARIFANAKESRMSVDIGELQRRFESLTDSALLAIKGGELVDAARQCLDSELAKRGLGKGPGSFAGGPSTEEDLNAEGLAPVELAQDSMPPGVNWALLEDFDTGEEVSVAVAVLRSAGIHCYTPSQDASLVSALSGPPANAYHVYVPEDLVQEALEILNTPISDEELAAQAEAAGSSEVIEAREAAEAEEQGS
jgi:hypothetical protein